MCPHQLDASHFSTVTAGPASVFTASIQGANSDNPLCQTLSPDHLIPTQSMADSTKVEGTEGTAPQIAEVNQYDKVMVNQ